MKTKDKVLELLLINAGQFVSGQEIAEKLYVTRASVWKAIKSLRASGVDIDAVTNKGYRIKQSVDEIDADFIIAELSGVYKSIEIQVYDEVTSTNDIALSASRQSDNDILTVADCQTKGRGRRGRDFYSPKGTGIYMSYAFKPERHFSEMENITAIAALALAKAIDEVIFDNTVTAQIKWVNDIYIDNHKIAGILTEGYTSYENPEDSRIVIGWGINVYMPVEGFPKDIVNLAGYLIKGEPGKGSNIRTKLVVSLMKHLNTLTDEDVTKMVSEYDNRLCITGSYVKINRFNNNYTYGYVRGINDKFHLMVEYDDGKIEELSSGEVSVVKY